MAGDGAVFLDETTEGKLCGNGADDPGTGRNETEQR